MTDEQLQALKEQPPLEDLMWALCDRLERTGIIVANTNVAGKWLVTVKRIDDQ